MYYTLKMLSRLSEVKLLLSEMMRSEVREDMAPSSSSVDSSTVCSTINIHTRVYAVHRWSGEEVTTVLFLEATVMTGKGNTDSVAALTTSNCSASLS